MVVHHVHFPAFPTENAAISYGEMLKLRRREVPGLLQHMLQSRGRGHTDTNQRSADVNSTIPPIATGMREKSVLGTRVSCNTHYILSLSTPCKAINGIAGALDVELMIVQLYNTLPYEPTIACYFVIRVFYL